MGGAQFGLPVAPSRKEAMSSLQVGFHVDASGKGEDCGRPVSWHDSPERSWLECACGESSLDGKIVTYGAPVVTGGNRRTAQGAGTGAEDGGGGES